jgi:hypothetical protein
MPGGLGDPLRITGASQTFPLLVVLTRTDAGFPIKRVSLAARDPIFNDLAECRRWLDRSDRSPGFSGSEEKSDQNRETS